MKIGPWRIDHGDVILLIARHKYTKEIILPSMELAFVSCAQSVRISAGILSHVIPSGNRRYTCAEDKLSTWNFQLISSAKWIYPDIMR